jgi:hypothetical protein
MIEVFPSGNYVDLIEPKADTILIEDIAHHLALTCRYSGGVRRFYSVAEHCCLVADLVKYVRSETYDPAGEFAEDLSYYQQAALMHDAAEYAINDVTAPAKWAMRVLEMQRANPGMTLHEAIDMITYHGKSNRSVYDDIGDVLDDVIAEKFGFDVGVTDVRVADLWAMRIEAEALTVSKGSNWRWPHDLPYDGGMPGDVNWFGGLSCELAEQMFLRKYKELFATVTT